MRIVRCVDRPRLQQRTKTYSQYLILSLLEELYIKSVQLRSRLAGDILAMDTQAEYLTSAFEALYWNRICHGIYLTLLLIPNTEHGISFLHYYCLARLSWVTLTGKQKQRPILSPTVLTFTDEYRYIWVQACKPLFSDYYHY